MKSVSLSYILKSLAIAASTYLALNVGIFLFYYHDTFAAWQIPYTEDFDTLTHLDYRQFGGQWHLEEGVLAQTVDNDTDLLAVIPLDLAEDQPYQFQTHIYFRSPNNGGGMMFNLQNNKTRQESHLVRFGVNQGQTYLVYGYFTRKPDFVEQGSINSVDLGDVSQGVDLAVRVRSTSYSILVNGQVLVQDIPLLYLGGRVALTTWFSQIAFDNISIIPWEPDSQVTEPIVETPSTSISLAITETFDTPPAQNQWLPLSGNWHFGAGTLSQTTREGFDSSIIYTVPTQGDYRLHIQLRHQEGIGGGVLFNMPQLDSKNGAHLVRYYLGDRIVWGYFDAQGAFQGQGDAPITFPGNGVHSLEVTTQAGNYAIRVDNQLITENIPLFSPSGFVGLTTSESVVDFDFMEITPADQVTSNPTPIGQWTYNGNQITQSAPELAEYFSGLAVRGETFEVNFDLLLPPSSEVAGGVLFHAPSDTSPAQSYAVRLLANGQLVWGSLDTNNTFQPVGSATLTVLAGKNHLTLEVYTSDFDVFLNGQQVASAIPLPSHEGWVYLSSVGGPVTFSDFSMKLISGNR